MREILERASQLTWYEHLCLWPMICLFIGGILVSDGGRAILAMIFLLAFAVVGINACGKLLTP